MTDGWLIGAVAAVIVSGALAIAGIERGVPLLTRIFKPLATILLLAIVGWPHSSFAWLVVAGILLSLVGDVALLSDSDRAFMVGLVGFLAAHVLYIIANLSVAVWSPIPIVVGLVDPDVDDDPAALRAPVGDVPLRIATIIYGTAISTMVISAWATIGSHLTLGAVRRGRRGALLHLGFEPGARSLPQEDSPRRLSGARGLLAGTDRDRDRRARAGAVMAPSYLAATVPSYDYIVVGSGAGGGPVAAALARAGFEVLLLEAGSDRGSQLVYQVPVFHGLSTEDQAMRWDYFVQHYEDPARQHADSKYSTAHGGVLYPRAGTLGGCTAHNAMITVYPHNSDWDGIAERDRRQVLARERDAPLLRAARALRLPARARQVPQELLAQAGAVHPARLRHGVAGQPQPPRLRRLAAHQPRRSAAGDSRLRAGRHHRGGGQGGGHAGAVRREGHPQQAAPDLAVDLARPGRVRAREVAGRSQRLAQRRAQHRGDRARSRWRRRTASATARASTSWRCSRRATR